MNAVTHRWADQVRRIGMKRKKQIPTVRRVVSLTLWITIIGIWGAQQVAADALIDPNLRAYRPEKRLSGSITSRGSDTMRELMLAWSKTFRRYHPGVAFDIVAKGSGTAPEPLLKGITQVGPMSRKMKEKEYQPFIEKYGARPVAVGIGLDTLAVYINRQNPTGYLSLVEIDAIFSKTRNGGYKTDIRFWGEVGLEGEWETRPIRLYTRNTFSGTFEYFRKRALFKGEYKDSIQMQPDSEAVVMKVINDPAGIGFSGIGYDNKQVKTLALSERPGEPAYSANHENVYLNRYPLSRPLYIYVVKTIEHPVSELVREFIAFVLSRDGQQITLDIGYMPLSAKVAERQFDLIR